MTPNERFQSQAKGTPLEEVAKVFSKYADAADKALNEKEAREAKERGYQ